MEDSGVICQKKWGMISVAHFESKRCYSGATHGVPQSWTATGLVCRAPPHLQESGEEQVGVLEMTHRPAAGGIEYGFGVREMERTGGLAYPKGGIQYGRFQVVTKMPG